MAGMFFFGGKITASADKRAARKERTARRQAAARAHAAARSGIKASRGGVRIVLKVEESALSVAKRTALSLYLENMHKLPDGPLNQTANKAVQMMRTRMLRGRTPDGQPFAPLSESYTKRKREMIKTRYLGARQAPSGAAKPPASNLFLTGSLQRSLRTWIGGRHGKPTIMVGVKKDQGLAQLLHEGRQGLRPMPARPFLAFGDREVAILSADFERNLRKDLRERVLKVR